MIWKIAKKEFLLNLMTFKFAVGTIVCVVLTAVFMPILAKDYQQRLKTYNGNVARTEAELRKVKVYRNIMPTIYRPPSMLSAFSEGLEKRVGNSATIEMDKVPEISAAAARGNPYLSIFSVFDASLIFKIVISVLALLVAYDAVSGERERGTLKLMLSGAAARHHVLLGKLLAGLMVLVVPITIAFILGLVILLSFPMVDLAGSDWIRIGLMYLASLIFISAMYNIGLLFSCLARRSAISLVLGLFVWIVFVVVIPNGSVYLAAQILPPETADKIEGQVASIREVMSSEISRGQLPRTGDWHESDYGDAFGNYYVRQCSKAFMEDNQKRYSFRTPLEIKYADKFWEVENSYLSSLFGQKQLADNLSRLSPICLYDNAMSMLAGTNIASFQSFIKGVKTHRNRIIDYIRSKTDNFSATSFFTTYTKEEMEQSPKNTADPPSLDLSDLPRFVDKADIAEILRGVIPDLALLVFGNVLFFAMAFAAFVRYDVR